MEEDTASVGGSAPHGLEPGDADDEHPQRRKWTPRGGIEHPGRGSGHGNDGNPASDVDAAPHGQKPGGADEEPLQRRKRTPRGGIEHPSRGRGHGNGGKRNPNDD